MPRITVGLLRKCTEHNTGIISSLEEISLYQEELEKSEVIGAAEQHRENGLIAHLKMEGPQNCEFLNKSDLTVNIVDFDSLEESSDRVNALDEEDEDAPPLRLLC
jgi:protein TilB